jgi:hypothetical protein
MADEKTVADNAREVLATTARSTHWLLDRCEVLDEMFDGKRLQLLAGFSLLLLAASHFASRSTASWFAWAYFILLVIVVMARVGACRDEDNAWSTKLILEQWHDGLGYLSDLIEDFSVLDRNARVMLVGQGVAGVGTVLMAFAVCARLTGFHWLMLSKSGPTITLFGGILWAMGWAKLNERLTALKATTPTSRVSKLPSLVRFAGTGTAMDGFSPEHASDPVTGRLLEVLASWKPPTNATKESKYERSLLRHVNRTAPELLPEQQVAHSNGASRCRFDLVVGGTVAVELKKKLNQSEAQRAAGQISQYADAWTHGPVLLLVVHTDHRHLSDIILPAVTRINAASPRVTVVTKEYASAS